MDEQLDIAFVASGDPSLDTFSQIQSGSTGPIWRLATAFARKGHQVKIFSGTYESPTRRRQAGVDIEEIPTPNISEGLDRIADSIPMSDLGGNTDKLSTTRGVAIERLFGRLLFSFRVARAIKSDNHDIVYLRDRMSAVFPALVSSNAIFTLTSPDASEFYYKSTVSRHPFNRILFAYKRYIEESVLENVKETIVMNSKMKDYLYNKGFDEVSVVTLGMQPKYFVDPDSRQEKPHILYVGRLDGNKRPAWLFDSFLKSDFKKHQLHFIGSGPQMKSLKNRAKKYNYEAKVKFYGRVPRSEVLARMQEASALVLPSEFENCPNVIVEAMASGCPVIASDTMGARELLEDGETGLLFDSDDKEDLGRMLQRLLQDSNLRDDISRTAYERAREQHTIDRIADQYLQIGRRALDSKVTST